jgi:DNA-binding FadR family transcriptional regulator
VRDWRAHGGLDVLVHALGGGAALDDEVMRSVMEARGLLLADAARLAAERRDEEQAALLRRLAGEVAAAGADEAAQGADFAFFATLIAASGNLVLLLVANSIRDLYFARLADFRGLVRDRGALAGLYAAAAAAVAAGDGEGAARAVAELTAAQEAAWLEGLE